MDNDAYQKLRTGETAWLPLSQRALWKLSGHDRVRYLNGQITNDLIRLAEGKTLYAAVTTAKGRMVGDLFVGRSADALWLDADISLQESLRERLEKYLIADDAVMEEVNDTWRLSHVFGLQFSPLNSNALVFANPRFGLAGFDVWQPGTEYFSLGYEVSPEIAETLRITHGLPRWGLEMNTETLPPEAGLDQNGISYNKGCYVGQETMARIKSIGHVNKVLSLIQSPDEFFPAPGAEIFKDGTAIGKVTSSTYSPTLQKGIALGYVQRQHAFEGQKVQCENKEFSIIQPLSPSSPAIL